MRVSPIVWAFDDRDTVLEEAKRSAEVTHDHAEGIRGAQATALAVYLARSGANKEDIRSDIEETFGYDLSSRKIDYKFEVSCQKSVPESLLCFLESDSVESAARLAVILGGDSDTQACIACGIAEAYYGPLDSDLSAEVRSRLSVDLLHVVDDFGREMESHNSPHKINDTSMGGDKKYPQVRCYLLPPNGTAAALPPTIRNQRQKTIYLVRHGRSQHNKAADEIGDAAYDDEAYYDAELVDEGLEQAVHAGVSLRNKGIGCVVASPLTRCLQTASIACANDVEGMGGPRTRRVVIEHVRESGKYGHHPYNRRRAKEAISPQFPDFDFGEIAPGDDTVWALEKGRDGDGAMVQARCQHFLDWLAEQPEDTFAVFSHCVFLQQLLDVVLDMQPCTENWQPRPEYDGGTSWFNKGQVQGFVLVW